LGIKNHTNKHVKNMKRIKENKEMDEPIIRELEKDEKIYYLNNIDMYTNYVKASLLKFAGSEHADIRN